MLNDIKNNRAIVMGLVEDCPGGKPLQDCIVNPFRKIHFIDAHVIVRELSASDLMQIINHHKRCLAKQGCISSDTAVQRGPL